MLVRLCQEAQAESGNGIVAPAAVQTNKKLLVLTRVESADAAAERLEFLRRSQKHVEVLNHNRGKLQVFVRLENFGQHEKHALHLQLHAQLAYD